MNTARRLFAALTVALLGCGPFTANITTTGGGDADEGPSSSTDMPLGSTGLGGTETGLVDTGAPTDAESSGADSGSSTGDGSSSSSSSGEPPPVCVVNIEDQTAKCVCDGVASDPALCGCTTDAADWCTCPGLKAPNPCYHPHSCTFDPTIFACTCKGVPSSPWFCDCVYYPDVPSECACDGYPAPAEYCQ